MANENNFSSLDDMNDKGIPHRIPSVNSEIDSRRPIIDAGPSSADMARTMTPVDVKSILPKKEPKPTDLEFDLMGQLDEAVDRECASITDRINQIEEVQRQEFDASKRAEIEEAQAKEDSTIMRTTSESSTLLGEYKSWDDELGLTDDDDDEDTLPAERSHNMSDENVMEPMLRAVTPIELDDNTVEVPVGHESISVDATTGTTADAYDTLVTTAETVNTNMVTSASINGKPTTSETRKEETKEEPPKKVSILSGIDDDDLFSDDDEEEEDNAKADDDDANEELDMLKKEAKEKIAKFKVLDLSKFSIAKKSVSYSKAMKISTKAKVHTADWALVSEGRSVSVTGLSGPEILKLNPSNSSRNRLNTFRDIYRIIYDHVYDANKPNFETWLKRTRFIDLNHLYFALYMATFGGSTFLNYTCPKCNKPFLHDVSVEDMVVYANDEAKKKVQDILKMDTTSKAADTYPVDLVQISDNYVFGLRTPSIWNVIIETASLSDEFLEKHADLIDVVSYIDSIYIIDEESARLVPIDTKPDPEDQARTSARRIKIYYDVINSLSSEEYYMLRSKITAYDEDANVVSYQIPGCTCPEPDCGGVIEANKDVSPSDILFTRHQLAALGNM